MYLLQEAIAAGGYFLPLLFILVAVAVLGVTVFKMLRGGPAQKDVIDKNANADENTTNAEEKIKRISTIIIVLAMLVAVIVFGKWLCNIKLD